MTASTRRHPERILPPGEAILTFEEIRRGYSAETAVAEAERADGVDLSAAQQLCPFGVDVSSVVQHVKEGRFDAARAAIERSHPWPRTMGRHCGRYCERAAIPSGSNEPIALGLLERAAGDYGRRSPAAMPDVAARTGPTVAVVGAGASGAAVTFGLRQRGHDVTVVEALPRPGGMLYAGYPAFRMPLEVLEDEFDLEAWGAELRLGSRVTSASFSQLVVDHDAVVIANGLHREIPIDVPGEEADGVMTALELLTAVKAGARPDVGGHVVVVGAGHTAQDAARTCRRLGAEVTIVYRGPLERMPVTPGKQQQTVDRLAVEGIQFLFEHLIDEIVADMDGRVERVLLRSSTSDRTESPKVNELRCSTVVKAVGVFPDFSFVPDDIERRDEDDLLVIDKSFETSRKGIFALGTVIGTRTTSGTLAEGLRAADAISIALKERAA